MLITEDILSLLSAKNEFAILKEHFPNKEITAGLGTYNSMVRFVQKR